MMGPPWGNRLVQGSHLPEQIVCASASFQLVQTGRCRREPWLDMEPGVHMVEGLDCLLVQKLDGQKYPALRLSDMA